MAGASLRRLSYFVAVARERNFTRAAERLRVAQPALSRQVRLLEQELGVDLLRRTTHQVELTEAGEYLLERAPGLLASADELFRRVQAFGSGQRGRVVVGYGASAGYETAPELLRRLAEHHPHVELVTELRGSTAILEGLRDGSLDLGLVRCPPPAPELERRLVRAERQGVLLRHDHHLATRDAVALADLASETLLLHPREANPGHYDAVLQLCREAGVEPHLQERALSFDLAQTPVLTGRAVAIVGESTRVGLAEELRWIPLVPRADLAVVLLARGDERSPAVGRLLEAAAAIAASLGWTGHAAAF
jgi:DNA-binding transcriptional LysR family regulator